MNEHDGCCNQCFPRTSCEFVLIGKFSSAPAKSDDIMIKDSYELSAVLSRAMLSCLIHT